MRKIVIIGSDSFIASCMINKLNDQYNFKLISRISSGKKDELIKENLFDINYLDLKGFDVVINFAAIVHQPKNKDKSIYESVNYNLPIHLANESKKAGVHIYVQMSSIAVYGDQEEIDENTIEKPNNIYGFTKLEADNELIKMLDDSFNVCLIRPPMVYGGGKSPGNMKRLIDLVQKGLPLPFKALNNKRDFIHVYNLVYAINLVIENNLNGIILPTDMASTNTEEIIILINKLSDQKVRLFKLPIIFRRILKYVTPSFYHKLFGNLIIECNLPHTIYIPEFKLKDGIIDMLNSRNT